MKMRTNRLWTGAERHGRMSATMVFLAVVFAINAGTLPTQALTTEFQLGSSLYAKGQYQEACDAFIDAICLQPRYFPSHYQLANTYLKLGKFDEAQTEYEMCLDLFPDAKTKSHCKTALKFIAEKTGKQSAQETEESIAVLESTLVRDGQKRLALEHAKNEADKREMLKEAEAKADRIRENGKAEVEKAKMNSDWWYTDAEKNARLPVITPVAESAILKRADARADAVINKARAAAEKESPTTVTDITDGLRSQLRSSKYTNVQLSPVGTNVYVRNYKSTGKQVASGDQSR